jgi:site-specific recombinase
VIPIALVISYVQVKIFGGEILSETAARNTIASLDPTQSLTLFYGALTGVILWLSSIGAGWTENWFVLRRVPETLNQSPWLKRVFGKRAGKIVRWINKNISGIGGNLCLGFLLAFVPVAGSFFGLPLEVRHVTLSAGSLTYAFYVVPNPTAAEFLMGAFSVFCIGILNFGVSFAAALFVAIRAREVRSNHLHLLRRTLLQFAQKRWRLFFYPSKNINISNS